MDISQTQIFLALGEPTRLTIVELLAKQGELTATQISSKFRSSASAISQHLKVLREARVVRMQKRAQQRVYQLDTQTLATTDAWIKARAKEWNARLGTLDDYVQTM